MALSNRTTSAKAEAAAAARDERAQEFGDDRPSFGGISPGYVRATSPEDNEVTFVPGEALPDWASEALDAGRGKYDQATGVWSIDKF